MPVSPLFQRKCWIFLCLISCPALSCCRIARGGDVLERAHAHNDYLHKRPLLDALDQGFCSVEADIFLVDGELLVAHSILEISKDRTLKGLYLDPLRQRIREHGGMAHRNGPPITLLIDIKNNGADTWVVLNRLLANYSDVFSRIENGVFYKGAVNAVISGDRAVTEISETSPRYAGIDGRVSDLKSRMAPHLMPLISDNWKNHFRWRGQGEMQDHEKLKLKVLVTQTHRADRKIRFWGTPDRPEVWKVLNDAGVDLINTDDLPGLNKFLRTPAK